MAEEQSKSVENLMTLLDGQADKKQQLQVIEDLTRKRLARLLHVEKVPESFDDILQEVMLKRFRRLGNEGFSSYKEGGESIGFPDSDFDEYKTEIADYLEQNGNGLAHKAGVWFV